MNKKNTIYYWASDLRSFTGEGILANHFLSDIKKYNKNFTFININKNNNNYHSFYNKYYLNFFGAVKLWQYYFKGKKIIYINYLPIWNFLIFLILPPKTLIGPITGTIFYNKNSFVDKFLRGLLFNILKKISIFIIFFKQKEILFSTELLKLSLKNEIINRCHFNYILETFSGFYKKIKKRKIDFLIYHRLHNNKNNALIKYFIKNTLHKNYKIVVVGDPINSINVQNKGYISRNKLKILLRNTKYTFGSSENLYTLFLLDSISEGVFVFYDKKLKIFHTQIKYCKMLAIDFDNVVESFKIIISNTNNLKILEKNNYIKKNNYAKYFNQKF